MLHQSAKIQGSRAETQALCYLKRHGLKLIERNFHCRQGEIDLIMHDKLCLIFIEVRYRRTLHYGSAVESVTWAKQQRIVKTAQFYLNYRFKRKQPKLGLPKQLPCRFDVVGISSFQESGNRSGMKCHWVKQAFDASCWW